MLNKLHCFKMMMGLAIVVLIFTQGAAIAEDGIKSFWKVGTLLTYEGIQWINGEEFPFDEYVKCSGRVILPETQPNMYYLLEAWGRDSETMIMRPTPFGGRFYYYLGNEYEMPVGPVGTTWEATVQGETMRGEIVEVGFTFELPTGEVYYDLDIMNLYCLSCGAEPVLKETHLSSRKLGFSVFIIQWSPDNPFIEWLVDITRK